MELREINVEDVYPDEKNPRQDFGDIAALAESCMLNAVNPGEPVNPIVVVQDGGIYRIVDGERRYKAMKANRLKRCHAVVCEGMDEANAMVAMVATDDKRQLTEVERSRGVQQMLLLGVDPEKVERAGRMAKGSAARLRRARKAVDDAGDDMTLDRMLAIAEFDEAGDEDAVEQLASCRHEDWRRIAKDLREKAENERAMAELRSKAAELGIELLGSVEGMSYVATCRTPGDLETARADAPEGAAYVAIADRWNGARVVVYAPDEAEDPEASAARELADAYANAAEKALDSVRDYLVAALMEGLYPKNSMGSAMDWFMGDEDQWSRRSKATKAVNASGWDGPRRIGKATCMAGVSILQDWLSSARSVKVAIPYATGADEGHSSWAVECARPFYDAVTLARADGWEMPLSCANVVAEVGAWLESAPEEETEEEE
ncbi:ParB/RepB/Spo0J family partition protein [Paraeggerthella sp.]|uniref:ParB/RepB/Spo0J family partition protein n=1 Tax=Paraeggerthella sp. TaxID=2897350 RepID=UPI003A905571